ncbi:MAG: exosortase C-terminal domain/associated protein EpsI [Planctomycetota bacterium]
MTPVADESQAHRAPAAQALSAAGAAAAAVLLLSYLDPFLAHPLRLISSVLAEALLRIAQFPVLREGTLLKTGEFVYDVVPACSGSNTLRVLLGLGIFRCGMDGRLSLLRKGLCALCAVPIALLANGARVASLVAASDLLAEPVEEGLLHTLIGLAGFALAMLGFLAAAEAMARRSTPARPGDIWKWIALGAILALLFAPFLARCAETWQGRAFDRFDRFGFLFLLAALIAALLRARAFSSDRGDETGSLAAFGVAMALAGVGALVDVRFLLGLSLLLALFSLALLWKGRRYALAAAPLLVLAYLGFPGVSLQLNTLTSRGLGLASLEHGLLIRALAALMLLGASGLVRPTPGAAPAPARRGKRASAFLVLTASAAAVQAFLGGAASGVPMRAELDLPWILGTWEGFESPVPAPIRAYYEGGQIWMRSYRRGGQAVEVLITASGGNRRLLHPPEYCLTGEGWRVAQSRAAVRPVGGVPVRLTRIRMERGERTMRGAFWFSDGELTFPDYFSMLMSEMRRRLAGRRTNWLSYRILTDEAEEVLDDFLASFRGEAATVEAGMPRGKRP